MAKTYILNVLKQFQCLGSQCEANCCRDEWDIVIDKETHSHWLTTADAQLRDRLLGAISPVIRDRQALLHMAKDAGNSCVHLSADSLCGLQKEYGAQCLPVICREYPRLLKTVGGVGWQSATLSCPEIARLVIGQDDGPAVEKISGVTPQDPIVGELSKLTDKLLSDSKFQPVIKILYLSKLLGDMATASSSGEFSIEMLQNACTQYRNDLYILSRALKAGKLKSTPRATATFWRSIYHFAVRTRLISAEDTEQILLLKALSSNEGVSDVDLCELLVDYRVDTDPIQRALNRYLHASCLNKGFPLNAVAGNYIATFLNIVVAYAVIRLLWWSRRSANKETDMELLKQLIYTTERRLGHGSIVYEYIAQQPDLLRLDGYHGVLSSL